ncbi:MAG: hypothetical protein RLZZ628_3972 [Bacteroidota bacterium]|jgi:hypothetical protein
MKTSKFVGMTSQDKVAYNRHIENRRVEMNVMDTLKVRVEREKAVQVAKTFLAAGIDPVLIAQGTQLTLEEVQKVARGEDILENYI